MKKCVLLFLCACAVVCAQKSYQNGSSTVEGPRNFCGTDTGSGNAYVCSNGTGTTIAGYVNGNTYSFTASHANTGASTLAIDGHASVTIKKQQASADLIAGDIQNGALVKVQYDGTYFEMQSPTGNSGSSSVFGPNMPGLATFEPAVHNAANQVVNIVLVTDSIGVCYQGSSGTSCLADGPTSAAGRYTDQLRAYFAAAGQSHGTGLVPVQISVSGNVVNGAFWSMTGTWVQSSLIGPTQTTSAQTGSSLIQMASSATASFVSQLYDHLNVYCATAASSTGLTVVIDGTTEGTACGSTSGSPTATVATFSAPGGLGVHTAVITSTGANGYLYGAEGTIGTTGVSLHLVGQGGAVAEMFGTNPTSQMAFTDIIPGGIQLVIISEGTNEQLSGESVSSYTAAMGAIITHEQALTGFPSILVWNEPPNSISGAVPPLSSYWAAAQGLATTYGTAYLAVGDRWGTYAAANAQGLLESDGVHPNNKGHLDMFAQLEMALLDVNQYGEGGIAFTGGAVLDLSVQGASQFPQIQIVGTTGFASGVAGLELKSADGTGQYNLYAWGSGANSAMQIINQGATQAVITGDSHGSVQVGAHIGSSAPVPTIAGTAALGTGGASPTIFGHDTGGFFTMATGTSPTSGTLVTITFNTPWVVPITGATFAPYCVVGPESPASVAQISNIYLSGTTPTTMTIAAIAAPTASTAAMWYEWVCTN